MYKLSDLAIEEKSDWQYLESREYLNLNLNQEPKAVDASQRPKRPCFSHF